MSYCPYCGAEVNPDAKFCSNCGKNLSIMPQFDISGNIPTPILSSQAEKKKKSETKSYLKAAFLIILIILIFRWILSFGSDTETSGEASKSTQTQEISKLISEQEIYSDGSVTLTAKDLSYSKTYKGYILSIEASNKSEDDYSFYATFCIVNGFSIDTPLISDVLANTNSDLLLLIPSSDLKLAGVERIADLRFDLEITNKATEQRNRINDIEIHTAHYGTFEQQISFNGVEVYNADGIVIKARPESATNIKHPLTFYVENNTDHRLSIRCDDTAMNGKMVYGSFYQAEVQPHTVSIKTQEFIDFGDSGLSEIDKIEAMNIKVSIWPNPAHSTSFSTSTLFESNSIEIKFE